MEIEGEINRRIAVVVAVIFFLLLLSLRGSQSWYCRTPRIEFATHFARSFLPIFGGGLRVLCVRLLAPATPTTPFEKWVIDNGINPISPRRVEKARRETE